MAEVNAQLRYHRSVATFPIVGNEGDIYFDGSSGTPWMWLDGAYRRGEFLDDDVKIERVSADEAGIVAYDPCTGASERPVTDLPITIERD